jgi:hypothetical protein
LNALFALKASMVEKSQCQLLTSINKSRSHYLSLAKPFRRTVEAVPINFQAARLTLTGGVAADTIISQ